MDERQPPDRPDPSELPTTADAGSPSQETTTIGPYKLLRLIAEGGMGEVWLAEQREPIRRNVALKLIRWGMDTERAVARFDAERQALAVMDHPNIAKVFDAGVADSGRPYFVMEYVPGVPINDYCDDHGLSTAARLELFSTVCDAVQHAHRKGILHRDLKPSNILVARHDDRPAAKVIDFGIAKAVGRPLTDRTLVTEYGALIGTPEYMSPEQAEMNPLDVDTRSDVYSLGVLLYELLTGTLPFDRHRMRRAGLDEMRRILRETDPPRPSERLATLDDAAARTARHHRGDAGSLARSLRGDLDWIVMRAIERDRSRRYGSASELADDVRRHLADQPVTAGPPGVGYRIGKFARRHRLAVGVAGATTIVLLVFAASMVWQGARVVRERDRADQEARTARRALAFLAEVFGAADPSEARGDSLTAREILERGAERVRTELVDEPAVRATLLGTIGEVQANLGMLDDAEPMLRDALALRIEMLGPDHPESLKAMHDLASVLISRGELDEAGPLLRDALAGRESALGPGARETLKTVEMHGRLLRGRGDLEGAERFYRQALEGYRALHGEDHEDTLTALNNVGFVVGLRGKLEDAAPFHVEALEGFRRLLGDDHPTTLTAIGNVGFLYQNLGQFDDAERMFVEALEGGRRVLGGDHPDTLRSLNNLAYLRNRQGRIDEAAVAYREVLEGRRRTLGEDHPMTLQSINNLGRTLWTQGDRDQGARLMREALDARMRTLGRDHPDTVLSLHAVAGLTRAEGRDEEVVPLLREAHDACLAVYGPESPRTLSIASDYADALVTVNRAPEAEPILRAAVDSARSALPGTDEVLGRLLHMLGRCQIRLDRAGEAEASLLEAHATLSGATSEEHPRARSVAADLAALYEERADAPEAERWRALAGDG